MSSESSVSSVSSRTGTVFLPADPPRAGMLALCGDDLAGASVEVVVPAGTRVRREQVPARLVPVLDALELLPGSPDQDADPSRLAWAAAALAGLGLV
ncbi:MAG TPA: hypothetical protein VI076_13850, partial [Actinopolymorphaceae bacterium]